MRIAIHLGLGDAIVSASIIAQLAKENKEVIVPCWSHNLESIKSIFALYRNVKIEVVESDKDFINYDYKLGVYNETKQKPNEDFIEWFYRQANLKEKYFPFEINNITQLKEEDIFIHDDKFRGFKINKEGYRPERGGSILKHINQIKGAKEIHCIDSSFIHLVERIGTKAKLFYHKYARPNSTDFKFKKQWEVLNENN